MKYILHPQSDNSLSITTPVDEENIESLLSVILAPGTPYKIVETVNIDSIFYNAYEFDQDLGAKANISKAQEIWKDKWRKARKPLLEQLDVEFIKALEQSDTAKQEQVIQQKQALRDVTDTPLPDTVEGIKSVWPEILN